MAVTYATALKTTRMQAVADSIDADSAAGYIEIGTAAMAATLLTITLDTTCGTVTTDTLTFSSFPKNADCTGAGTLAAARIKDGAGNVKVSGLTVGTSGANINLDSVAATNGKNVKLTSATIQHG
jgi:hypothetical protein